MKFTAAVAQLEPVFLDSRETLARCAKSIREAGALGVRLLVFPEALVPGYPYWAMSMDPMSTNELNLRLYREAVTVPGPALEEVRAAAREAKVFVVLGVHERAGGTLYNTQVFIDSKGELVGRRRKLVPTSHERLLWGRGDGSDLRVFDTELGRMGGLICYEHMNSLFRYAIQGQGQQLHVAGWPGGMGEISGMIDAAIRHYAFEGQCFVLSASSVLTAAGIERLRSLGAVVPGLTPGGGCSLIVSPWGEILAGPEPERVGLLTAEIDLSVIDEVKMLLDCGGHYARPDVVRLWLDPEPRLPVERAAPGSA